MVCSLQLGRRLGHLTSSDQGQEEAAGVWSVGVPDELLVLGGSGQKPSVCLCLLLESQDIWSRF